MELREVIAAVLTMDGDDLNKVVNGIRMRREQLAQKAKRQFFVGATVEWDSKYGTVVRGTIQKINRKNIRVRSDVNDGFRNWVVHPNLLRYAEEKEEA